MRVEETERIRSQVERHMGEDASFKLIECALKVEGVFYQYLFFPEESEHLILDEHDEVVPKWKAIPVFEKFILLHSVLNKVIHNGPQFANRKTKVFEDLQQLIRTFRAKIVQKRTGRQENMAVLAGDGEGGINADLNEIEDMIDTAFSGQKRLQEIIEETKALRDKKCVERGYLYEKDLDQFQDMEAEMDWILYSQGKKIDETVEPLRRVREYIRTELSMPERFLRVTPMVLNLMIKQFTNQKVIEQNRQSMQTFESDADGNVLTSSEEGVQDVQEMKEYQFKVFQQEFDREFLPRLKNE